MSAISTFKVGRVHLATSLQSNESAMEIDNHTYTTVLGSNCLPIHGFGRLVDVSEWDASAGSVEYPTIFGAILYDHPTSGKFYIPSGHPLPNFNNSLDMPDADSDVRSHN